MSPDRSTTSEDAIAERVLDELRTAVSLRKVSDVPVGVFLSGGIDSSTNAALFSEGERSPVKTFSIGYADSYRATRTSSTYARRWRRASAPIITNTSISVDDVIDFLPRMVQLQDEPIGDPVCVPLFYVAKLARDNGVVVCQLGEGADELFIGYPSWLEALKRQQWNDWPVPQSMKQARLRRPRGARLRPHRSSRVAAPRRARTAAVLERRRGVHRSREAAAAVAAAAPALAIVTSWDAIRPIRERFEARAPGAVASELDVVRRSQPAPARAAADARRQDDDGRRARRAGAVPGSSSSPASRSAFRAR